MTSSSSLYGTTSTQNSSSSNSTSLYGEAGTPIPDSSGNVIVRGTLTVNGCAILTNCSSFSFLPLNATSIGIGASATSISIGANTGTTTVNNDLVVDGTGTFAGDITATGADFGNITIGVATDNTITTTTANLILDSATGIVNAKDIQATVGGAGPAGGLNLYSNDATNAIHLYDNYVQIVSGTIPGADWVFNEDGTTSFPSYVFPYLDGTVNQVLTTNGAGVLSFTDVGSLDTTYTIQADTATGGANLTLVGSDATTDSVKFANGGGITATYTSGTEITLGSTATSANTASAIVARDASGNFSAGTITATLSGTATQVSNSLTAGTHLSGGPFNGSSAVTLTTDATSANTASTIVSRDASGDFSAGVGSFSTVATPTVTNSGGALLITGGAVAPSALTLDDYQTTLALDGGVGYGDSILTTAYNALTWAHTAGGFDPGSVNGTWSWNTDGTTDFPNYTFPYADGTANQILKTNGSGILSWFTPADLNTTYDFNATSATGGANLNLVGSDATTDTVKLTDGGGITATYTSGTEVTLGSTATSANTASAIVARDASGNFSASGATLGNVTVGVDTDQTISTSSGNLTLQTAAGVNAGTVTLTAGANGAITLDPNGTGSVVNTFSNGGNVTNDRNYITGSIRNATTRDTNGDIWELNTSAAQSATNPYFRGVSLSNSSDTTRGPATLMRSYTGNATPGAPGSGGAQRGRLIFEKARGFPEGVSTGPSAVQLGDLLGSIDVTGYSSTGWINDTIPAVTGFFGFAATENWVSNTALGTNFSLSLAPTATTISTGANLIQTLNITPQTFASRSDAFTWANGKTGTTQTMALDVSGNLTVTGDVRINGNDIQCSSGASAITLTSANTATTIRGDAINLQTAASAALPSGKVTYGRQYIEAYSTQDQTNPVINTENLMSFNNTGISNGVSIVTNGTTLSRITMSNAGVYNIQFSAQLNQTSGGAHNAFIWLKKNGANVANSAGDVRVAGNGERIMAAWNYVVDAAAGDYYELAWSSDGIDVLLDYVAASAPVPAVPSVILTVVPVGA